MITTLTEKTPAIKFKNQRLSTKAASVLYMNTVSVILVQLQISNSVPGMKLLPPFGQTKKLAITKAKIQSRFISYNQTFFKPLKQPTKLTASKQKMK